MDGSTSRRCAACCGARLGMHARWKTKLRMRAASTPTQETMAQVTLTDNPRSRLHVTHHERPSKQVPEKMNYDNQSHALATCAEPPLTDERMTESTTVASTM